MAFVISIRVHPTLVDDTETLPTPSFGPIELRTNVGIVLMIIIMLLNLIKIGTGLILGAQATREAFSG